MKVVNVVNEASTGYLAMRSLAARDVQQHEEERCGDGGRVMKAKLVDSKRSVLEKEKIYDEKVVSSMSL